MFNRNRQLIRRLYALRIEGRAGLTAREMQHVVKSSMVMDRAEHTALLEALLAEIEASPPPGTAGPAGLPFGALVPGPQAGAAGCGGADRDGRRR
ncbi:2-hydroxyacyl-CoA dehydratase [Novosphingobium colocasiae]